MSRKCSTNSRREPPGTQCLAPKGVSRPQSPTPLRDSGISYQSTLRASVTPNARFKRSIELTPKAVEVKLRKRSSTGSPVRINGMQDAHQLVVVALQQRGQFSRHPIQPGTIITSEAVGLIHVSNNQLRFGRFHIRGEQ